MATYNGEKYISRQLESILNQKNVEIQILVRDDGSSDRTQEILEKYKGTNKIQWYAGKHLNVCKGYFELMKQARDYDVDYFAFADQDDVWDDDKLVTAINALEPCAPITPSLYYCGQRLVDKNLKFMSEHRLNEMRTLKTRFVLSDFAGCTGVFNKPLLDEVIKYEPEYMLMHDTWILKICLCLGGNVIVDSAPHMSYRQHGGNTVGLGRTLPAYIRQVKQYIYEYNVEKQMIELRKGYSKQMVPEYDELSKIICNYKNNKKYKKYLLDKKNINFYSKGLNFTYWIKVKFNKL